VTEAAFQAQLIALANAARTGLQTMTTQQRGLGFEAFPSGTCGPVSELMGRIVLERTGQQGIYVCGDGHPDLKAQQSHAWLEVEGFIVDLTYDQLEGTGLVGWVHQVSPWYAKFDHEPHGLSLSPGQCGQYPYAAYGAMKRACDAVEVLGKV
jgi:hypothetical protein